MQAEGVRISPQCSVALPSQAAFDVIQRVLRRSIGCVHGSRPPVRGHRVL